MLQYLEEERAAGVTGATGRDAFCFLEHPCGYSWFYDQPTCVLDCFHVEHRVPPVLRISPPPSTAYPHDPPFGYIELLNFTAKLSAKTIYVLHYLFTPRYGGKFLENTVLHCRSIVGRVVNRTRVKKVRENHGSLMFFCGAVDAFPDLA